MFQRVEFYIIVPEGLLIEFIEFFIFQIQIYHNFNFHFN